MFSDIVGVVHAAQGVQAFVHFGIGLRIFDTNIYRENAAGKLFFCNEPYVGDICFKYQ
jgi:hypothetical protein